jgi:hypothetical protein
VCHVSDISRQLNLALGSIEGAYLFARSASIIEPQEPSARQIRQLTQAASLLSPGNLIRSHPGKASLRSHSYQTQTCSTAVVHVATRT